MVQPRGQDLKVPVDYRFKVIGWMMSSSVAMKKVAEGRPSKVWEPHFSYKEVVRVPQRFWGFFQGQRLSLIQKGDRPRVQMDQLIISEKTAVLQLDIQYQRSRNRSYRMHK